MTKINETISCGLDTGTSSLGWGLVDVEHKLIVPHPVVEILWRDRKRQRVESERFAAGVVKFEPVERKEGGKWVSRSGQRGLFRRNRNRVQRKQWRLEEIVHLFRRSGLIPTDNFEELFHRKGVKQINPITLRKEALERTLSGEELFRVCYHIAAHRAFEANSKAGEEAEIAAIGDNSEAGAEAKKPRKKKSDKATTFGDELKSLTAKIEQSGLTPATYFEEHFTGVAERDARYRGTGGRYDRIFKRKLLIDEIQRIFAKQRELGNRNASAELEDRYRHYAFYIKQGQDSEKFVGPCSFAQGTDGKPLRRAPRFAPSYERYRFLAKLATLRLADGTFPSSDQRQMALERFGDRPQFTWAQLAGIWGLDSATAFKDAPKNLDKDVVNGRGSCALGTAALSDAFAGLASVVEHLDLIATRLTHLPDIRSIETALRHEAESGTLPFALVERAIEQAKAGAFRFFKGTGSISIAAARMLSDQLLVGKDYAGACQAYGWRHEAPENSIFAELEEKRPKGVGGPKTGGLSAKEILAVLSRADDPPITSPGARKAVIQAFKQFGAIVGEFGWLPGRVHVELSRDIGKSLEEREKIDRGHKAGADRNNRLAKNFEEIVGRPPRRDSEDMLRFKLWREQQCRCPYRTNMRSAAEGHISGEIFRADRNGDGTILAIDHILPRSWSADESYENKVLCFADENARKQDRTPFQYFDAVAPDRWEDFKNWADHIPQLKDKRDKAADDDPGMGGYKRRNLLVEDGDALARLKERLPRRHLNDNRYAARVLVQAIQLLYPVEYELDRNGKKIRKRRVFARPGQLIGTTRRAWGMNRLKYREDGQREDERNHAVDALICAAISERMLQDMTRVFQEEEQRGGRTDRALREILRPWPGFASDVEAARNAVFVVRTERKRARGAIHEATIYGGDLTKDQPSTSKLDIQKDFGINKGKYEEPTAREQLTFIKDPKRNKHIIGALENWIDAGAPREVGKWPKDQRDQVIRKVTLLKSPKSGALAVHGGYANRDTIVRLDLFSLDGAKRGVRWCIVPIYLYQILDEDNFPRPPAPEGLPSNVTATFIFSIGKGDYVEIATKEDVFEEGYYNTLDNGRIKLADHRNMDIVRPSFSSALTISKYQVDRFGRKSLVRKEVRTWHGEACISPNPLG